MFCLNRLFTGGSSPHEQPVATEHLNCQDRQIRRDKELDDIEEWRPRGLPDDAVWNVRAFFKIVLYGPAAVPRRAARTSRRMRNRALPSVSFGPGATANGVSRVNKPFMMWNPRAR